MMKILAVVQGLDSDQHVLQQSLEIASDTGGDVHVFMSVYDPVEELNKYIGFDDYPQVKEHILEEAEIKLRKLTEPYGDSVTSNMAWGRHWHLNVQQEAKSCAADLIVKAVGRHSRIAEFLQTPEDWHLLREAQSPIWMVNETTAHMDKVVAAFSTLDETAEHRTLAFRVLSKAQDFARALGVPLHVVTAVPDLVSLQTAASRVPILLEDVQVRAQRRAEEVLHKELQRHGISPALAEVRAGRTEEVLAEAVGDNGLLVIGSVAHRGLAGKLIGNTAEKVLHYLTGDVLVVH